MVKLLRGIVLGRLIIVIMCGRVISALIIIVLIKTAKLSTLSLILLSLSFVILASCRLLAIERGLLRTEESSLGAVMVP